jgi:hypothetical protein
MLNTLIVQEGVGNRQTASLRVYEKLIVVVVMYVTSELGNARNVDDHANTT